MIILIKVLNIHIDYNILVDVPVLRTFQSRANSNFI